MEKSHSGSAPATQRNSSSTIQKSAAPKWRESFSLGAGVACLCGLAFFVSSATINAHQGLGKGGDNDTLAIVFATVAVAASALLALTPSAFLIAAGHKRYGSALFSALAFVIAGLYSVTAALGAASGARFQASAVSEDVNGNRERLQRSYSDADAALARLPATRPPSALQAEIDGLLRDPRTEGCAGGWNGKVTRTKCPLVDALRKELASAKKRSELEVKRDRASEALASLKPVMTPNTDATALADFSAALGFHVGADTWNRWLVILTVLLVELGAGLSFAVGIALRGGVAESTVSVSPPIKPSVITPPISPLVSVPQVAVKRATHSNKQGDNRKSDGDGDQGGQPQASPEATRVKIIEFLKRNGGQSRTPQRALAKRVGASQSRVNQVLKRLVNDGAIILDADKRLGTKMTLAVA